MTYSLIKNIRFRLPIFILTIFVLFIQYSHAQDLTKWQNAWPNTDFSKTNINLSEIMSGGPGRDGIPPIDDPIFAPIHEINHISPQEPVIGLIINGEARAYPLQILMWHEIVNDMVGDIPVAITFCPLCNAAIVFNRQVDNKILSFGTTGNLRYSDLIMWDRQTDSWWQQFTGTAIVGDYTDVELEIIPSRLESFENFKRRTTNEAKVLIPNNEHMRPYGQNPYSRYDGGYPFLYKGDLPQNIKPLARVVSLHDKSAAWSLDLLKEKGEIITTDGTRLKWTAGQNSALDTPKISAGKDVGNIIATKNGHDVPYFVEFAFAFYAFNPDAPIHKK